MEFLTRIFGENIGHLCVVTITSGNRTEYYFEYPSELSHVSKKVEEWNTAQGVNVYFYPVLFGQSSCKEQPTCTPVASSDLNMVSPILVSPRPTTVVESSLGRFQAYWENTHNGEFAPLSVNGPVCIDTKLRRLPGTRNWKYKDNPWKVREVDPEGLASYERVKVKRGLTGNSFENLFHTCDRQSLARLCARLGCSTVETFLVLQAAQTSLDTSVDSNQHTALDVLYRDAIDAVGVAGVPSLLTDEEARCQEDLKDRRPSFVDRYVEWATRCTDSPKQYHIAGALTVLSIILSPHVQFPTLFGEFRLNLWFMILADTTRTRKTTAMQMAIKLAESVDPDCLLTNSGSVEGILNALPARDGKSSIFFRDEVSGLLMEASKKQYMSGVLESLTGFYDGMGEKRVLRKSVIQVEDPYFQILCGGVKTKTIELLDIEHISSGFLPRFMLVCGETRPENIKPIGPPEQTSSNLRDSLVEYLDRIHTDFSNKTNRGSKMKTRTPIQVQASQEAWERLRQLEGDTLKAALRSDNPDIFAPMYDRLKNSIIKVAVLLAADRAYAEGREVHLEVADIITAISYSSVWIESMHEVARGIEDKPTKDEIMRTRVERFIRGAEDGVQRGDVMRKFRLTANIMNEVESTLIQRGLIVAATTGRRSTVYRAVSGELE